MRNMKRGAVDVVLVISVVVALVGFVVLLYFLLGLDFDENAESKICEVSVLTRATTPASAQNFVPLKCTTNKICLTQDGECKEQFAGEEKVEVIDLPKSAEDAAGKIEEVSAKAMYDCWNIMGQGKLDLFGSYLTQLSLKPGDSTCVICSRVAIDKDVGREVLEKVDINNYMENAQVPGKGLTYVQAFTNRGTNTFARIQESDVNNKGISQRSDLGSDLANLLEQDNREMAFVFMQIKTVGYGEALGNLAKLGVAVAGGTFMTPVIGKAAGKLLANPYVLGGALVVAGGVAGYSAYNVYESQMAAAGYCGEFASSEGEGIKGCSIVQGIPYDDGYINKLCGVVQGNQ